MITTPTYGPSPVPPEDIVAKIDEWVPRDEDAALLWRRTDVPSRLLIDARNEILRLRARVEVLERALRGIADYCEEGHRQPYVAIANTARDVLKETAP